MEGVLTGCGLDLGFLGSDYTLASIVLCVGDVIVVVGIVRHLRFLFYSLGYGFYLKIVFSHNLFRVQNNKKDPIFFIAVNGNWVG